MKLHLQTANETYLFSAYGDDFVAVNGVRHGRSLIVTPKKVFPTWQPVAPDNLGQEHFAELEGLEMEILLLGTGTRQRFPSPRLIHALAQQGIGMEAMDTFAACRTYNILAAEGRKVAAALIIDTKD